MEDFGEEIPTVQEMELLEPNYEVFMKWAHPTTTWNTVLCQSVKVAIVRYEFD